MMRTGRRGEATLMFPDPLAWPTLITAFAIGVLLTVMWPQVRSPGPVRVRVLAHTLNLGAGGPQVPISIALGDTIIRNVQAGDSFLVDAPGRIPIATAGSRHEFSPLALSTAQPGLPGGFADAANEPRAYALKNGDRVPHLARSAYGRQAPLSRILRRWLRPDGRLRLRRGQTIAIYEFTTLFHDRSADFQDLVLLLESPR